MANEILLVANGDLRLSANRMCWPAQRDMEAKLTSAIESAGGSVRRAHEYDATKEHGFIDSQKRGLEVFRSINRKAPLVVAEAVWQYSQHILAGLMNHQGPILTVANWSGQWPGLVGMLNLNGSLTKAGVDYSTLWSEDFTDDFFLSALGGWINGDPVVHRSPHVHAAQDLILPHKAMLAGAEVADELKSKRAILGVFDEGCMGMYNAIIPDHLLNPTGVFKERLSQSALWAGMLQVSDEEAQQVRDWLDAKGMRFETGPDEATDLTDAQILLQCKMYIAALRIADEFGCDTIGIQYQQGLKDICPASDLVEGLLNNVDRPPAMSVDGRVLFEGPGDAALQRGRRVCRLGCFDHEPCLEQARLRSRNHVARSTLWRALHGARQGRVRLGVRNFGLGPTQPPDRRVCGHRKRTPAADVLPAGRRNDQRHQQAG